MSMQMIAQTSRDPWRTIWQIAAGDYVLVALLLGIAMGLVITTWLPQMPVANPAADPVAYAQWFSETQARFGDTTSSLQALGLFTVTRSLAFRILLAILFSVLLLRLVEGYDRLRQHREISEPDGEWHALADVDLLDTTHKLRRRRYRVLGEPPLFQIDRWPWADLLALLAHGGGVLLLIGLLITHLWGWRIEGSIVQSDETFTLPNTKAWVSWDEDTQDVSHSPGITVFVEEQVPGIQIQAADSAGQSLPLQQSPTTAPVPQLLLPLVEDQAFAIPEAQLIVRLVPHSNHAAAHSYALVQLYRSPLGELVTESQVEEQTTLSVDGVIVEFSTVPHARLTAVFNPGLWPTGIGIVFLVVGLLGNIVWPEHRFWLQENGGQTEAAGQIETTADPLPALAKARKD
jgi:hypothetical protein